MGFNDLFNEYEIEKRKIEKERKTYKQSFKQLPKGLLIFSIICFILFGLYIIGLFIDNKILTFIPMIFLLILVVAYDLCLEDVLDTREFVLENSSDFEIIKMLKGLLIKYGIPYYDEHRMDLLIGYAKGKGKNSILEKFSPYLLTLMFTELMNCREDLRKLFENTTKVFLNDPNITLGVVVVVLFILMYILYRLLLKRKKNKKYSEFISYIEQIKVFR